MRAIVPPPGSQSRLPPRQLEWIKRNLFSGPLDILISAAFLAAGVYALFSLVRWAFVDAVGPFAAPADCRGGAGACWVVLGQNLNLFLFGTLPADAHWRAIGAFLVLGTTFALFFVPFARRLSVAVPLYVLSTALTLVLLLGFDHPSRPSTEFDLVGGVLLTLILSWIALPLGLPLAFILALGRQSQMPVIRGLATLYIEVVRALPMVVVLFLASVIFPLLFEGGVSFGKVIRAIVAISLFSAAYQAEVIRGGLQSVQDGQVEAGKALGLGYWAIQIKIVFPQAMAAIIRPLSGIYVLFLKDTSLVSVIGLFELTGITSILVTKPEWTTSAIETYLVAGAVYVGLCLAISRLASRIDSTISAYRLR